MTDQSNYELNYLFATKLLNKREKAREAKKVLERKRAFSKRKRKFKKKIHNLNVGDIVWFLPDPETAILRQNTRLFSIVTKKRFDEITIYIQEKEMYMQITYEESGYILTDKEINNPDEISDSIEKDWNSISG